MQAFVCPFEQSVCGGTSPLIQLEATGTPINIETSSSFTSDKVCNYQIKGPQSAQDGDLIYLKLDKLSKVTAYASIGESLKDTQTAFCWI